MNIVTCTMYKNLKNSSSNSIYGPSKFRVFYLIGKQPRAAANGLIKFLSKRSSSYMCMLLLYILRRQRHYANFKFSSLCCCLAFDVDTIHFNKLFPAPFYLKIQNLFSLISHSFFFCQALLGFQSYWRRKRAF